MARWLLILAGSAVLLAPGCRRTEAPPEPSFRPLFEPVAGALLSNSSPGLTDLDGDGVADIVYGTGVDRLQPHEGRWRLGVEPEVAGYVTAVSGATNAILWRAPHHGEAFTTPRFVDLNSDGVADVVLGGRQGALAAFSGRDGAALWRVDAAAVAATPDPYNFFTPAVVADVNGDGVAELAVTYGGNDTRLPGEPRDAGYIVLVSGADGALIAVHEMPDARETYSSVVTYARADGSVWLIFGTGGETHGGAAYRAPVASLADGSFARRVERLIPPGSKGVMAPATLVELNGDGEPDIVISTFDGRLFVLDGASGQAIWSRSDPTEETYHPAAVMRIARDGRLGLVLSRAVGAFPQYVGSVHRILDAQDGRQLYQYRDPLSPAGAPLAVDLTGDGIDEPFFFAARGRIHVLHGYTKELIIHDVPANLLATPHIADPRATGTLELIGVAWINERDDGGLADWRHLKSSLLRLDLSAATPAFRSWSAYMGTAGDGRYRAAGGAR